MPVTVRLGTGVVSTYAENISRGGLFLLRAEQLSQGDTVTVEIALPDSDQYRVQAEVRHVLSEEAGRATNRRAGAGLMFRDLPESFVQELQSYLLRLSGRRDVCVLSTDDATGLVFGKAGYVVQRIAKAEVLVETLQRATLPTIGVVVRPAEVHDFTQALVETPLKPSFVLAMEDLSEAGAVLMRLDNRLEDDGQPTAEPQLSAAGRSVPEKRAALSTAPRRGASWSFTLILAVLLGLVGFSSAFLLFATREVRLPYRPERRVVPDRPRAAAMARKVPSRTLAKRPGDLTKKECEARVKVRSRELLAGCLKRHAALLLRESGVLPADEPVVPKPVGLYKRCVEDAAKSDSEASLRALSDLSAALIPWRERCVKTVRKKQEWCKKTYKKLGRTYGAAANKEGLPMTRGGLARWHRLLREARRKLRGATPKQCKALATLHGELIPAMHKALTKLGEKP